MKIEPEELCDGVTLYEGDCLDVIPHLTGIDAVVTDPPYGIGYDASASTQRGIQKFGPIHGDTTTFDPSPFMGFKDCILWGCNNYCHAIPPHQGQWYFWDKVTRNDLKVRIAEGEFAWHKCGTKPRAFRHLWSGAYRASEHGDRPQHPTQKPVKLLRWCISLTTGRTILDPFAGSGTTAIAAMREGRKCILIEKDSAYCDIIRKRVREAAGIGSLFDPSLLGGNDG